MGRELLRVDGLDKRFGGIHAVNNVSFSLAEAEIVGLIGPNGSGKTTLINLITGMIRQDSGKIVFRGRRIENLPPYKRAALGLGRTFQITQVFRRMTVFENLLVPALATHGQEGLIKLEKRALEILEFLRLTRLKDDFARSLSGGQQKLLELGRVLMLNPELLFLDEPFAGVHPELRAEICQFIGKINSQGKAFVVVSHDMGTIFSLSKRLIVLNHGEKIADGPPEKVRGKQEVIEAYLGDEYVKSE